MWAPVLSDSNTCETLKGHSFKVRAADKCDTWNLEKRAAQIEVGMIACAALSGIFKESLKWMIL